MQPTTILILALVIAAIGLYIVWRKQWMSTETLTALAAISGMIAVLATIALFVIPAAQLPVLISPTSFPNTYKSSNKSDTQATDAPTIAIPTTIPVTHTIPPSPPPPLDEQYNSLSLSLTLDVKIEFVRVPAGTYQMRSMDSQKQRVVSTGEYWIGKTEVTNAQFAAFINATGYKTTAVLNANQYNWLHPRGRTTDILQKANHPVVNVSWYDAVAFCKWVSEVSGKQVSLPTEAEWEKAAMASDLTLFPWGDTSPTCDVANFSGCGDDTVPVGSKTAGISQYGALDMLGNVWEWTSSLSKDTPYNAYDGREDQSSDDPRVLRGGGFNSESWHLFSEYRLGHSPETSLSTFGFRIATTPT